MSLRDNLLFYSVAVMALVGAWFVQSNSRIVDDAFITYRYSANVVEGHGLVYNEGQAVLGTTTPGYALILAGLAALAGVNELPTISLVFNSLLLFIVVILAGLIAYRATENRWAALVFMVMALLSRPVAGASRMGMETPLFLALLVGGLWAAQQNRWRGAALLVGLMIWVRPESVFAIGLLGLEILRAARRKDVAMRRAAQAILLLGLPGLINLIALTAYYGSPVPQSAQAKMAGLYPFTAVLTTGQMLLKLTDFLPFSEVSPILYLLSVMAALPILAVGGVWLSRRGPTLWMIPALLALLVGFFGWSATMLFIWYDGLYRLFYLACLWAGLSVLLNAIARRMPCLDHRAAVVVAAVWIFAMQVSLLARVDVPVDRDPPLDQNREIMYYNLARQIEPLLPEDVVIAMPEIGVLGFYLRGARVLDTAGLVSPEAVDYFPVPREDCAWGWGGCIPRGLILDHRPDLVIFTETLGKDSILADPKFLAQYAPVVAWEIDGLPFDDPGLFVYSRRDFAPGMALAEREIVKDYPLAYDD